MNEKPEPKTWAEAEVERLRAALERVAYYGGVYRCKERRAIARRALEGSE